VSKTLKIFRRRGAPSPRRDAAWPPQRLARGASVAQARPEGSRRENLPEVARRAIVERIAPPVIVVDGKGNLLFASQKTNRYFEPPTGATTLDVFAMAREGLALPLRSLLRKALRRRGRTTADGVRFRSPRGEARVDLCAWPLDEAEYPSATMVAFLEAAATPHAAAPPARSAKGRALDHAVVLELRHAKSELERLMRDMTESQEALQGMNEELQSTNEELQSTNEELTTSKEEMQSMNEELLSLNAELQTTNERLATANDDMRNLLDSSQIPTLFLDAELRLKRYTERASRIAKLIPTDVGRPITDLAWRLRYATLAADVKEVLHTLRFKEAEVAADDGSTYTMRIHPYRTVDDVIDGVVVTFVDVTAQKREADRLAARERHAVLEATVGRWPGVAYVEDVESGRTLVVSTRTERVLGYPPELLANATEAFWIAIRRAPRGKRLMMGAAGSDRFEAVAVRRRDGTWVSCEESRTILSAGIGGVSAQVLHVFRMRSRSDRGDDQWIDGTRTDPTQLTQSASARSSTSTARSSRRRTKT
jgi:two-component system CheB/CheR fusion protein